MKSSYMLQMGKRCENLNNVAIKFFLQFKPFHVTKPILNLDLRYFIKMRNIIFFVTYNRPLILFYK